MSDTDPTPIAEILPDRLARETKRGWIPHEAGGPRGFYLCGDDRDRAPMAFLCELCGDIFREADRITLAPTVKRPYPWTLPTGPYSTDGFSTLCATCAYSPAAHIDRDGPAIAVDVPAAYMAADVEALAASVNHQPLRARLKAWPTQEPMLGIVGCPGSGKTWICYAALKQLAKRGRVARLRTFVDLKIKWQGAILNNGRERLLKSLVDERYLILDDLSAAEIQPGWREFVHALLDTRLAARSPTLITRAMDGENVERLYGAAIRSRLAALPWIQLDNVDRRVGA